MLLPRLYDLDDEEPSETPHYLDAQMYAKSADASPESWVLLSDVKSKRAGKKALTEEAKSIAKVKRMSEAERAAMRAALDAY